MKVSVVVPFYRDAEFIAGCLKSVVEQSYGDWECLLVDDCGGDATVDVCREFCNADPRFRILTHKENQGMAAARNTALEVATGDYLFFLDADDKFCDNKSLEILVDKASKENPDWVQGAYLRSNGNLAQYGDNTLLGNEIKAQFSKLNFSNAAGKLVSRQFIEKNDLIFSIGLIYEDLEWNLRAYQCIGKISNVSKPCYYHNLRDNSVMRSRFTEKKAESALTIIEKFTPLATDDKNIANVLIYKALFVLKNVLMGDFSNTYKRQIYKHLRATLKLTPPYEQLPPFTKILARVRKSYLLSNLLCKAYKWSR